MFKVWHIFIGYRIGYLRAEEFFTSFRKLGASHNLESKRLFLSAPLPKKKCYVIIYSVYHILDPRRQSGIHVISATEIKLEIFSLWRQLAS